MKTKILLPENITKVFRKFDGTVNIQVDGGKWIGLSDHNDPEDLQRFMLARNLGSFERLVLDEDGLIVSLVIDKYKKADPQVLEKLKDLYGQ